MSLVHPFELFRNPANPLLLPDGTSPWESLNVFNPAVIQHDGLFHMIYRAQGHDRISRFGYAVSSDGIRWNRLREPVLVPELPEERRGVEDPRLTLLDGTFYLTYHAYGAEGAKAPGTPFYDLDWGSTTMIARSRNLIAWERIGAITRNEDNKDHMLFPRRFGGRFLAGHRRRPDIWLAESDDLTHWPEGGMRRLAGPRPGCDWEGKYIGLNGVPVETEAGWLAFYHGADVQHIYRIGVMLLDREDPSRILLRPRDPIFWPREMWELYGDVPRVVFSCANIVVDDEIRVYYSGADHVIGLATARITDLLEWLREAGK